MKLHALRLLIFVALGGGLGVAYLNALAWNVRLYCARLIPLAPLLHLLRFAGTVLLFVGLAQCGAVPLLSTFVGFQLARIVGCAGRLLPPEGG